MGQSTGNAGGMSTTPGMQATLQGESLGLPSSLQTFGQKAGKNGLQELSQSLQATQYQQPQLTGQMMPQVQQQPMMQLPQIQTQVPKWAQGPNYYGG